MHQYRLLNNEANACYMFYHLLFNLYAYLIRNQKLAASVHGTPLPRSPTLDALLIKHYCFASNLAICVPSEMTRIFATGCRQRIKMVWNQTGLSTMPMQRTARVRIVMG